AAGSPRVPQMPSAGHRFRAFRLSNSQTARPWFVDPPTRSRLHRNPAGCRSGERLDNADGRWNAGRPFEESKTALDLWSCQTIDMHDGSAERRLGPCRLLRMYLS